MEGNTSGISLGGVCLSTLVNTAQGNAHPCSSFIIIDDGFSCLIGDVWTNSMYLRAHWSMLVSRTWFCGVCLSNYDRYILFYFYRDQRINYTGQQKKVFFWCLSFVSKFRTILLCWIRKLPSFFSIGSSFWDIAT